MDVSADLNLEIAPPLVQGKGAKASRRNHHDAPTHCQNCSTEIRGDFCHACGQTAHVHRSMGHVLEEVIHGITHLDSRTWRSLPMLLVRPGTLTRNYVMGKRARYVPPFAMFLASVFAMFLAFAFSGGPNLVAKQSATGLEAIIAAQDRVNDRRTAVDEATSALNEAKAELTQVLADPDPMPGEVGAAQGAVAAAQGALTGEQAGLRAAQQELDRVRAASQSSTNSTSPSFASQAEKDAALGELDGEIAQAKAAKNNVELGALNLARSAVSTTPITPTPSKASTQPKTTKVEIEVGQPNQIMAMLKDSMKRGDFIVTPWPEINKKIKAKTENPDLFLYKLQNTVYKFSFLLVPLSLPFIWLMFFWKRGVTLFDHAVFALYSLSFLSFLFLTVSVLGHWFPISNILGYAMLIMPLHLFFQFKGAYALNWFSALWRTVIFSGLFAWLIIVAFVIVIVTLGVTG